MSKTGLEFGILVIVICLIFVICYLEFYSFGTPKKTRNLFLDVLPTKTLLYTFTTWLPEKNHFSTREGNPTHMPLSYRVEQDG